MEVFLCSGPLRRAALFFGVLFGGGFWPIRPPRSLAAAAPAGDAAWLTPQAPRRGCRWPQVVRPGSDPRVGCHSVSATRSPTPGFPLDDNGRSATGDSPWPSRGLTWHRVVGSGFSAGLCLVQTWRGSHGFRLAAAPARFLSPLPTATIGLGWGSIRLRVSSTGMVVRRDRLAPGRGDGGRGTWCGSGVLEWMAYEQAVGRDE